MTSNGSGEGGCGGVIDIYVLLVVHLNYTVET